MPSLRKILSRKKRKEDTSCLRSPAGPTPPIDPPGTWQGPALDRANNRIEKYGLFPLHPPVNTLGDVEDQETYALDIVAVHGITGNAYDTWIHDNGNFWLRDLIPKDLPGVRVFSYGYPAEVFCTLSIGTLDTFARSLLEGLKRERRKKEVRPIENIRMRFHKTG
jgi:hypothetical protein